MHSIYRNAFVCIAACLLTSHYTLGVTGFAPLQCDLSVLVKLQAASSLFTHRLRTQAQADSQQERFNAPVTSLSVLCLVLWTSTCMCLIALFDRASAHILRAFYSADKVYPLIQPPIQLYMRCACARGRPSDCQPRPHSQQQTLQLISQRLSKSAALLHCNNDLRDAFQCMSVHCAA